jgi:REP element-mobilizing transposase RayT
MASRRRKRVRHEQLTLDRFTWGGARPGAGRKKSKGSGVPHTRREELSKHHPLHITLKVRDGLESLRGPREFEAICLAFLAGKEKEGFRLVHFSVMENHIHLIVEADDKLALARGLQGLKVRIAKKLNKLWNRRGSVFADRYHAVVLRTPNQVRHALAYVLNNARKHGKHFGVDEPDPCSSGDQFHGWDRIPAPVLELGPRTLGLVAKARTWLLNIGWRRHGLIPIATIPGRA